MTYEPQVNDYVMWSKGIDGWVYFKDKNYITIECCVRPKDKANYKCCSIHANDRLLVVCYRGQWNELKFVKSRKSVYETEKDSISPNCESTGRESK